MDGQRGARGPGAVRGHGVRGGAGGAGHRGRAGAVATSRSPLPAGARVLAAHDGPPLAEAIKAVNKPSQNLHAETMLRLLGARAAATAARSGPRGGPRVPERMGVDATDWSLQDGSGLSRSDL